MNSDSRGSNSRVLMDVQSLLHPFTELARHERVGPLIIRRGQGATIYDDAGRDYIEGMAGLWCASLGFSDMRVVNAIKRQLDELPNYHLFSGKSHGPAIELADRLKQMAPAPMARVFFGNSGSDANDTALKIVWYYNNAVGRPKKKKVIARHGGYHGSTIAAASLSGITTSHRLFDLPIPNIVHTDCPHYYHFAKPEENEEDFASRLASSLDELIIAEGPETIAAFIAEPVMGAGGVIVPPRTYFEKIQPLLRKYDILLIADEVICGFGRTGQMWGSQTFHMEPDILTCAKALSSGYLPISATMVSEPVYRGLTEGSASIGTFGHGFTYSGHPVAAAAALATLEVYEEMDILSAVQGVSGHFQKRLGEFITHPLVGETRGVGLVGGIELSQNKAARKPFPKEKGVGAAVVEAAQRNGLIVRTLLNDSVSFCPPLVITEPEIDAMFDRFGAALDEVAPRLDH